MVLRKVGAANWISFIVFAWGLVTLGLGFSKNWGTVAACRAILGCFEAGLYPGMVYMISSVSTPWLWKKSGLCSVQAKDFSAFLNVQMFSQNS
jgi:MFS family permease